MIITTPKLPPKMGYVEIEVNGIRTYSNVATGEVIGQEIQHIIPQDDTDALEVDHEYRITLLELGVTNNAV